MDTNSLATIAFIIVLVVILIVIVVLVPAPNSNPQVIIPLPSPHGPRQPVNPTCNSNSAAAIANSIRALPTSSRTAFCNALQKGIPTSCSSWQINMMDSLAAHNVIFSWTNGSFYPINMLQNQCSLVGASTMTFSITDDKNRVSKVVLSVS